MVSNIGISCGELCERFALRLALAGGLWLACLPSAGADVVSAGRQVEPLAAYSVARPARGVDFLDREGRRLYFGHNQRGSTVVFAPHEAVAATADLIPLVLPAGGRIAVDNSFWREVSKPRRHYEGAGAMVEPGGYAVSGYIPACWKLVVSNATTLRHGSHHITSQLWYDADYNLCETNNASWRAPEACWFRIFQMYTTDERALYLEYDPAVTLPFPEQTPEHHRGEVVLAAECDLRERLAATEIVRHVKLITGKALPLVSQPSRSGGPQLFVGRHWAQRFKRELRQLAGSDGFAIRQHGDHTYLFGATSRGTLYGAFRLLELNSDIIWYRPDRRYGTRFTPRSELRFDGGELLCKPAFNYRHWGGPGGNDYCDTFLWQLRNGSGAKYYVRDGNFTPRDYRCKELGQHGGVGGNWKELPLAQLPEREEFYAVINGKRVVSNWGQPCFSAPDLMPATIAEARHRIANGPEELDFFDYIYSDSWSCCECDACMAPFQLPNGEMAVAQSLDPIKDPWFRSSRTFMEASRLAAALDEFRPGLDCFVLAYIYTAAWPGFTPHKNIKTRFAAYDTSNMRFPLSEQTKPALYAPESWAARYQQWLDGFPGGMGAYEYFFTAIPAMFAEAAATNMQQIVAVGNGSGIFNSQTQPDNDRKSIESFGSNGMMWDMNAMDHWLVARLMWDPFQSVGALRRDFIKRLYGTAAPELERWYEIFGREWFNRDNDTFVNCHTSAGRSFDAFIIQPGHEKELRQLLATALAKVDHPAARRHLERKLAAFDQMGASLGRLRVPRVDEITNEWRDAHSPFWNRALAADEFRDPFNFNYPDNLATNRTEVRLLYDQSHLYFRIATDGTPAFSGQADDSYPMGDRVELLFRSKNRLYGGPIFALGADGGISDLDNWDHRYASGWEVELLELKEGWGAVGRIPLDELLLESRERFYALLMRVNSAGVESYLRNQNERHPSFPLLMTANYARYELDGAVPLPQSDNDAPRPVTKQPPPTANLSDFLFTEKPLAAGNCYLLTFEARAQGRPLLENNPRTHQMRLRRPALFWRWQSEQLSATNSVVASQQFPHMTIFSSGWRTYHDLIRAAPGATQARIKFLPPQLPLELEVRNLRLEPYDTQGAINLNGDFALAEDSLAGWGHLISGSGFRTIAGRRCFDTAYGSETARFPLDPARTYRATLQRTAYGGYRAANLYLLSEGKNIKIISMPKSDELEFTLPPETTEGYFKIYNSYLDSLRLEILQNPHSSNP